ncbi:AMP-binding protein [Pseudoalteromonas sp. SSDWG2]|uniref:AMP-binding protein n=1 Tax=Pseudoalteromonas sp. SSDWG2 TaxID=3139391 RepID=UPI003BAD3D8F
MKSIRHEPSSLIEAVKRIPQERAFLVTKDLRYKYKDIVALSDSFSSEYPYLEQQNCAVISTDRESLAIYLPAIDNLSNKLFLLPQDAGEHFEYFLQTAEIDYVIYLSDAKVSRVRKLLTHKKQEKDDSPGYILSTSGTTGVPKLVSYTLNSLLAKTKTDVSRGKDFTWGLTYDINRFAGLQVYLQVISSGSTLAIPSNNASMSDLIYLFSREHVNALSGTPSFWRKLLMEPNHRALKLHQITLGGEISNQSVLSALSQRYPSAAISHIYASTEAGVGFVVKDKKEGFPISFLSKNSNLACQLKIVNGNLWIKSANGCTKFLKGELNVDEQEFIDSGDMVKVLKDRVIFLGRESGAINVGGNKVMPEKIESILEQHHYVVMSKVYAKSNPVLGSLVACEVVLEESAKSLSQNDVKRNVLSFCREQLEGFEVPALLKVVDSIPVSATGKKVRY